jgi:aminoglycoside phosphotransferase
MTSRNKTVRRASRLELLVASRKAAQQMAPYAHRLAWLDNYRIGFGRICTSPAAAQLQATVPGHRYASNR